MVRKIFRKNKETTDDKVGSEEIKPPVAPEIISEEQKIFGEWANDWFQRNQYYAGFNDMVLMNPTALNHQQMLFLVGLAQNSDLIVDELRRLNKNIKDLTEILQEVIEEDN